MTDPSLDAKITPEAIRRDDTTDAAQNVFFINTPLGPGRPEQLNR